MLEKFGQMSLDNQVIIPTGKMFRGFRWDPSCTIQLKVGDPTRVEAAREEQRGLLRKIRKAIGAKRRTILLQFLIEAASICLLGGVIALALAIVTGLICRKQRRHSSFVISLPASHRLRPRRELEVLRLRCAKPPLRSG